MIHLSVIIPAYNEENRIANTLIAIDKYLRKQRYSSEILVVSDGSRDKTAEVVRTYQKKIRNLRLLDNKENHGKGYVVRQGMLKAKGKYRLFTDADNSTSIGHIEKFWPWFEKDYDVVIGSIELPGSRIVENAQWYRRWLGSFSKLVIRTLALWEIHDSQRGFKCFSEKSAKKIFPHQTILRWGFDIEVLCLAKHFGYKIKEIPVKWENMGESKVKISSYISTFRELLKIKLNFVTNKYNR